MGELETPALTEGGGQLHKLSVLHLQHLFLHFHACHFMDHFDFCPPYVAHLLAQIFCPFSRGLCGNCVAPQQHL